MTRYKKALVAAVSGMGLAAIIAGYAICLAAPTVQTSVSGKAASATHSWQGNTLYITAYPKANWRFVEGYTVAEDGVVDGVNGGHWYDLRGNFTCIL